MKPTSLAATFIPYNFMRMDTVPCQDRGRQANLIRKQLAMGAFGVDSQNNGMWILKQIGNPKMYKKYGPSC